jgi:ABC-type glycerol-3-phosphate transport system permease component
MAIELSAEKRGVARRRRRHLTISGVLGEFFKYVTIITLAVSFSLPFYWMASSALKNDVQVFTIPPIWIPSPAYWNNFWDAWTSLDFNLFTYNTVVKYGIPATVGTVISCAVVAYGFARLRWPGRDMLFAVCLATMMLPGQVTLVPLFVTFKNLGWLNTYRPLVVPSFFGGAFFIFLLRQFFMGIPFELSDAARIDGANEFGILWRIILPLSKPALAVVALFRFMGAWNDYFGPLVYVNIERQWPLALGIQKLRGGVYEIGYARLAYPYLMAVSAIVTLPILIAFFFAQRTFIEGISLTGLKG